MQSPIGRRVHVMGNTCAGKSTLARQLATTMDVPFVELDALYWRPGWQEPDRGEFHAQLREATRGEGWVVGGSYLQHAEAVFWDRLETAIFLDLPLPRILARLLRRSWRRSRDRELLWGTNYERFWPQLRIWDRKESLLGFAIAQHENKRRDLLRRMTDPRWRHVRFVRLCSEAEVDAFRAALSNA